MKAFNIFLIILSWLLWYFWIFCYWISTCCRDDPCCIKRKKKKLKPIAKDLVKFLESLFNTEDICSFIGTVSPKSRNLDNMTVGHVTVGHNKCIKHTNLDYRSSKVSINWKSELIYQNYNALDKVKHISVPSNKELLKCTAGVISQAILITLVQSQRFDGFLCILLLIEFCQPVK